MILELFLPYVMDKNQQEMPDVEIDKIFSIDTKDLDKAQQQLKDDLWESFKDYESLIKLSADKYLQKL